VAKTMNKVEKIAASYLSDYRLFTSYLSSAATPKECMKRMENIASSLIHQRKPG
jgi:hypothetical protein